MKKTRLICFITLFVVGVLFSNVLFAKDIVSKVQINVIPSSSENLIENQNQIPVVIFGSAQVNVRKIDLLSLTLGVHFYWPQAYVKVSSSRDIQCEISDLGSYSTHYVDNFGPVDGYNDLLCQFGSDFSMIQRGAQKLTLSGVINDGFSLHETHISGSDTVYPAKELGTIARCCIECDEGDCSGCNGDVYQCDKYLRVCDSEVLCKDCSRCLPPNIN